MKEKVNIIQFMPYFPPHKWGLETVWEEIGKYWVKNELGEFINVVFDVWQVEKNNYVRNWYKVILIPSFDLISNFSVPKFWKKEFWNILSDLKEKTSNPSQPSLKSNGRSNIVVITHTRFFLSSFIWWLFARKNNIKWIHIEHWSSYVKLSSKIKSYLSIIYDKIIWKWVFKKADIVLGISEACREFILNKFVNREVKVFYRGLEIGDNIKVSEKLKEKYEWKKIVWYVGRLYKWKNVEWLIKAFYLLDNKLKEDLQLVIVGDWEDLERLKLLDKENIVYFTWWKTFEEALFYQKQFDIHIHPSYPWWWLATTLLQAMYFWCMIVATPNEWAKEVIVNNKNWFLLKNDNIEEIKRGISLSLEKFNKKEEFSKINEEIINEKFKWDKNIIDLYKLIK